MDYLQKIKRTKQQRYLVLIVCVLSFIGTLSISFFLLLSGGNKEKPINILPVYLSLSLFALLFLAGIVIQYLLARFNDKLISLLSQSVLMPLEESGAAVQIMGTEGLCNTAAIENRTAASEIIYGDKLKQDTERNERLSENISGFFRHMSTLDEADLKFDFFDYNISKKVFYFISGLATTIGNGEGVSEITAERLFREYNFNITCEDFSNYIMHSLSTDIPLNFECSSTSNDGKTRWFRFWGRPSRDRNCVTGAITDITREVMERNIEKERANHDNITGFYNRNALSELASKAIAECRPGESVVFVYVGLTGYKEFQERFGMIAGNSYIQECAEVFKKFLNDKMIPLRWWGSDFLILVRRVHNLDSFKKSTISIVEKIEKYMGEVDGIAVTFPLAIGYSVSGIHSQNPSELLEYAAFAEHEALRDIAKSPNEFNRSRFVEARRASLRRTFIKDIINHNQLGVVFQPIVSLKTGDLFGFEALSRPLNPIYKNILELIDDAEATGHYAILEKRMVYNALDAYMDRPPKFKDHFLFINTAPYATLDEKDYNDIRDRYFGHMKVVFEVIERNRMEPEEINLRKSIVTKAGAKFALDDFGSGYSNHLALLALEPDIIKIDKELVRGIDDDLRKQHMLEDIISYARYRGTRVLAEGVETQGELETICRMGIDYVQGYFTGRPSPVLQEPSETARDIIKSISRNNQINMKQVFLIVQKSMSTVCEALGNSLFVTTFLMLKMGKCLGMEGEKLTGLIASTMLHDIGSLYQGYAGSCQNQAEGYSDESIFAYLLMKEFFPYPEYARMVLYHHVKLDQEVETISSISIPDEAYLLSLALSVSEILLNDPRDEIYEKINDLVSNSRFKEQYSVAVRMACDKDVIDRILNGEFKEDLLSYLSGMKIGKLESESIIRTLIYTATFRSRNIYAHARIMETLVSILARMTKQNWNLLEKVRTAALLYNLGMITMNTEVINKRYSPKELHNLLNNSIKTVTAILDEADLADFTDMLNCTIGEKTSSENRMLMSKDIIIGSNMLNLADIFSSLYEERLLQPEQTPQDTLDELKNIAAEASLYLPMVEMMEEYIDDIEARVNTNYSELSRRYQSVMASFEKLKSRISGNS